MCLELGWCNVNSALLPLYVYCMFLALVYLVYSQRTSLKITPSDRSLLSIKIIYYYYIIMLQKNRNFINYENQGFVGSTIPIKGFVFSVIKIV